MSSRTFTPSRLLALALLIAFAAIGSGCANLKLPAISAKAIHYDRSGRFTSTKIEAVNVVDGPDTVTADKVEFAHDNPWFNARITVEGYVRQKTPSEKK